MEETDKKGTVSLFMNPHYTLTAFGKQEHDSLHAESWIGEKAWLLTTDTGVSMTIGMDITAQLFERNRPSAAPYKQH